MRIYRMFVRATRPYVLHDIFLRTVFVFSMNNDLHSPFNSSSSFHQYVTCFIQFLIKCISSLLVD